MKIKVESIDDLGKKLGKSMFIKRDHTNPETHPFSADILKKFKFSNLTSTDICNIIIHLEKIKENIIYDHLINFNPADEEYTFDQIKIGVNYFITFLSLFIQGLPCGSNIDNRLNGLCLNQFIDTDQSKIKPASKTTTTSDIHEEHGNKINIIKVPDYEETETSEESEESEDNHDQELHSDDHNYPSIGELDLWSDDEKSDKIE